MPTKFTSDDIAKIFNEAGFSSAEDTIGCLKLLQAVNTAFAASGVPSEQIVANIENSMQLIFLQTQLQSLSAQQSGSNAAFEQGIDRTRSQLKQIMDSIRPLK